MGNSRTPLLLGSMILVVGIWVADQFKVFSFIDNWGKAADQQLTKLNTDIKKLEDLIMRGADADERLEIYGQRSLPFDPPIARSKYQDWLGKLVVSNQLTQSSIEVGPGQSVTVKDGSKKREAFKQYAFTVNATGTLEQVSQFLYDFYDAGHLHKINTMSLSRSGGRFALSIKGEAIGVPSCERKETLTNVVGDRLAKPNFGAYTAIVRRNVFSREVGATLKHIKLSAVTYDKFGVPEAWFKVGINQTTKKLQRDDTLTVSVHELRVIDIQPRSTLIDFDGEVIDLPIGKSLYDVMAAQELADI